MPFAPPHPTAAPRTVEEGHAHAAVVKDLASERVRAAGGPIDEALYTCECGFVFLAPVSTSVCCPHCGATQAW